MTLLTPATAILAASLAFPALAVLYLLKLRRRPIRVSSTVLWEQAAADLQVNMPLRWLKWSLLLLLHILIVALICLALGRPAIGDAGISAKRVVLVIDRSASMSANDGLTDAGPAARLDQAKQEATRILAELGRGMGGASAALVTFAAEPQAIVGMTPDLRLVRDELAKVTPTDQPGDLQAAMKLVVSMVSPEGAEAGAAGDDALVVILGDGAYESEQPLSAGNAEIRFVRCGPAAGDAGFANVGVTALAARRDDAQPSRLRIFARVINAAAQQKTVPVTLAINGETTERRAVTLPASTAAPDGLAGAGVTFEALMPEAGIVTVSTLDGDLLAGDDTASVVVAAALQPSVLFVTPGAATGGITPEGLLGDVLAELPLAKLDRVTPAALENLIRDGSITRYDLLVLDRADLNVLPAVPTLALGSSLPATGMTLAPRDGAVAAGYALTWKRTHPVLRDVAMDTVYVGRWRTFSPASSEAASAVKLDELARGKDGPLIRISEDGGTRRIATAFDIAQSNWALEPGFAIFLSSAVEYLTGRNAESAAVSFSTAARIELLAPETQPPATRVELKGPVTVEAGLAAGSRRVMVGPLERAGVYTTTAAPPAVAVNIVSETESAIRTQSELEVAGRAVTAGTGAAGPSEIWPWLVMAAAALLVVEWLAYGLKSRV